MPRSAPRSGCCACLLHGDIRPAILDEAPMLTRKVLPDGQGLFWRHVRDPVVYGKAWAICNDLLDFGLLERVRQDIETIIKIEVLM